MYSIQREEIILNASIIRAFQRRERLPMIQNLLWKIDTGMVRALTFQEGGAIITLGFWGAGDIVGYPLAGIQPYELECLSEVQIHRLQSKDSLALDQSMKDHIHQSQFLLMIRQGVIRDRLQQFLVWLVDKFGVKSENGYSIPTRLTHQDIAEAIGTTRVTVTRLIGELEKDGLIQWSRERFLLPHRVL